MALDVLTAVREEEAFANLALPKALSRTGLDQRDKGLVTELVYGSLRASGELDIVLRACISGRWEKVDAHVLDILRLGVYQVLHLRISVRVLKALTLKLTVNLILIKYFPWMLTIGFFNYINKFMSILRGTTNQKTINIINLF